MYDQQEAQTAKLFAGAKDKTKQGLHYHSNQKHDGRQQSTHRFAGSITNKDRMNFTCLVAHWAALEC